MQYTWTICELKCLADTGVFVDYVYLAYWQCTGADNEGLKAQIHGQVSFEINDSNENFVPYDDLTPELVIEWVKKALGAEAIERIEQSIIADIGSLARKKAELRRLPWNNN